MQNAEEQNVNTEPETPVDDGAIDADAAKAETAQETAEAEEAPKDASSELKEAAEAAQAKADEYLAMAQRVQADFDNFRRRNESARADSYEEGRRSVAASMLQVSDNLERALVAAKDMPDDDPLKSGVALTLRQLNDVFKKLEIEPIERTGEAFDPNLENAVLQGSPDEGKPGTVCQVLQKGYSMKGHVLRHAMVKVVPED